MSQTCSNTQGYLIWENIIVSLIANGMLGFEDLGYVLKNKQVEQFHSKRFQHNSIAAVSGTMQALLKAL